MGVFIGRDGRHVIHVLPEIPIGNPDRAGRERAVRQITEACSLAVERLIRIDPKQWVWFHHRWRGQETGNDGVEAAYAAEG
jgi:KDO2-lipid IV(A) lauroyltransferase